MAAIVRNLSIERGSVYRDRIRLTIPGGAPYNLTGCTAKMQIRHPSGTLLVDLSTTNGLLLIEDPATGIIHRKIPATQTALIPADGGQYDMEITPATGVDDTFRIYKGAVCIDGEQTRE